MPISIYVIAALTIVVSVLVAYAKLQGQKAKIETLKADAAIKTATSATIQVQRQEKTQAAVVKQQKVNVVNHEAAQAIIDMGRRDDFDDDF